MALKHPETLEDPIMTHIGKHWENQKKDVSRPSEDVESDEPDESTRTTTNFVSGPKHAPSHSGEGHVEHYQRTSRSVPVRKYSLPSSPMHNCSFSSSCHSTHSKTPQAKIVSRV